ncbi:MAG: hypothetical protein ACR2KL_00835, partial [Nocardioidaceae bacterium]
AVNVAVPPPAVTLTSNRPGWSEVSVWLLVSALVTVTFAPGLTVAGPEYAKFLMLTAALDAETPPEVDGDDDADVDGNDDVVVVDVVLELSPEEPHPDNAMTPTATKATSVRGERRTEATAWVCMSPTMRAWRAWL